MKFAQRPNQATYTTQLPGARATMLDGPASRRSRNVRRNTRTVAVAWTFDELGYQYARSFFRTGILKGAKSLTIDLILDSSEPTEYTAYLTSWKLSSYQTGKFVVNASLEVKCLPANNDYNQSLFAVYQAFGDDAPNALNLFSKIINENWPVP